MTVTGSDWRVSMVMQWSAMGEQMTANDLINGLKTIMQIHGDGPVLLSASDIHTAGQECDCGVAGILIVTDTDKKLVGYMLCDKNGVADIISQSDAKEIKAPRKGHLSVIKPTDGTVL